MGLFSSEKPEPHEWSIITRDFDRFIEFGVFLKNKISLAGNSGWLVSIGCGFGEEAPGLLAGLRGSGLMGGYLGVDVAGFERASIAAFLERASSRDNKDEEMVRKFAADNADLISFSYGREWDATKKDIWENIEDKTGGDPGIILLRHPDVQSYPEVFKQIFRNVVDYASQRSIPVVVTTSNDTSEQKIREFLGEAVGQLELLHRLKSFDTGHLSRSQSTRSGNRYLDQTTLVLYPPL